eukprot:486602_1
MIGIVDAKEIKKQTRVILNEMDADNFDKLSQGTARSLNVTDMALYGLKGSTKHHLYSHKTGKCSELNEFMKEIVMKDVTHDDVKQFGAETEYETEDVLNGKEFDGALSRPICDTKCNQNASLEMEDQWDGIVWYNDGNLGKIHLQRAVAIAPQTYDKISGAIRDKWCVVISKSLGEDKENDEANYGLIWMSFISINMRQGSDLRDWNHASEKEEAWRNPKRKDMMMMGETQEIERKLCDKQLEYWMKTYESPQFYSMNTTLVKVQIIVDDTTNNLSIWNGVQLGQYEATIASGGFDYTEGAAHLVFKCGIRLDGEGISREEDNDIDPSLDPETLSSYFTSWLKDTDKVAGPSFDDFVMKMIHNEAILWFEYPTVLNGDMRINQGDDNNTGVFKADIAFKSVSQMNAKALLYRRQLEDGNGTFERGKERVNISYKDYVKQQQYGLTAKQKEMSMLKDCKDCKGNTDRGSDGIGYETRQLVQQLRTAAMNKLAQCVVPDLVALPDRHQLMEVVYLMRMDVFDSVKNKGYLNEISNSLMRVFVRDDASVGSKEKDQVHDAATNDKENGDHNVCLVPSKQTIGLRFAVKEGITDKTSEDLEVDNEGFGLVFNDAMIGDAIVYGTYPDNAAMVGLDLNDIRSNSGGVVYKEEWNRREILTQYEHAGFIRIVYSQSLANTIGNRDTKRIMFRYALDDAYALSMGYPLFRFDETFIMDLVAPDTTETSDVSTSTPTFISTGTMASRPATTHVIDEPGANIIWGEDDNYGSVCYVSCIGADSCKQSAIQYENDVNGVVHDTEANALHEISINGQAMGGTLRMEGDGYASFQGALIAGL